MLHHSPSILFLNAKSCSPLVPSRRLWAPSLPSTTALHPSSNLIILGLTGSHDFLRLLAALNMQVQYNQHAGDQMVECWRSLEKRMAFLPLVCVYSSLRHSPVGSCFGDAVFFTHSVVLASVFSSGYRPEPLLPRCEAIFGRFESLPEVGKKSQCRKIPSSAVASLRLRLDVSLP